MKKFLIIIGLALGANSFYAQTVEDVELFNPRGLHGTPRFVGMGGAFTALGNDLSAIRINPAGIGVFKFSQFNTSLGVANQDYQLGPFYGTERAAAESNFMLDNLGFVSKFDLEGKGFGFAINFSRVNDFDREFSILGTDPNNYTLGEFWGESTANVLVANLERDLPTALAAYDAYLLVDSVLPSGDAIIRDSLDSYAYGVLAGNQVISSSLVDYVFTQSGSQSETNISFGGDIGSKLYYGLGIGIPTLSFRREEFITENLNEQGDPPYNATQYTYRRLNDIYATGFNFKLGLIYRPLPTVRLGVSYESPSWYTVNQVFEYDITARFNAPPLQGVSRNTASPIFSTGEYSYRLRTPGIWRFGLSAVLAKKFIASVDYHLTQPVNNHLYTNRNSYNISESLLNTSYQPAIDDLFSNVQNTVAAGLEYRFKNFFIRGGYRYVSSPYQDDLRSVTLSEITHISGGLGAFFGPIGLDFTFVSSNFDRNYVVYTDQDYKTGQSVQVLEDLQTEQSFLNFNFGFTYKW